MDGYTADLQTAHDQGYVNATLMCTSAGREFAKYYRNDATKRFLKALIESTGKGVNELVLITMNGVNESRGTWVHPEIAAHLKAWIMNSRQISTKGLVYVTTSPNHSLIKIGMWRSTMVSLESRYRTCMGPEAIVTALEVDDCREFETLLHCIFSPFAMGGEMFDKIALGAVLEVMCRAGVLIGD